MSRVPLAELIAPDVLNLETVSVPAVSSTRLPVGVTAVVMEPSLGLRLRCSW